MVSSCDFIFIPVITNEVEHIYIYIVNLDIPFCEVSVQVFSYFSTNSSNFFLNYMGSLEILHTRPFLLNYLLNNVSFDE